MAQSVLPDEIIIVDGGSTDKTLSVLKQSKSTLITIKNAPHMLVIQKNGNRAVGRNEAIHSSTAELILCSDAGCVLDRNWVRELRSHFQKPVDVVAGYYKANATTLFQKCLVPYVFVMPDKVDPQSFLPASRSMAFTKEIWEKIGKFDESLSHNEDYAFAKKLEKHTARIVFAKDAIVYWTPRETIREAFTMFWRFAYGDAEAGIFRPKVVLLFLRYVIAGCLVAWYFYTSSLFFLVTVCLFFFSYMAWAVQKNYRYVTNPHAMYLLPLIQLTSDVAVLSGTVAGIIKRIWATPNKQ